MLVELSLTYCIETIMKQLRNYFLVGPMGAGKTAVGRQLSRLLHHEFVDSDEEIEQGRALIFHLFLKKREKKGLEDVKRK